MLVATAVAVTALVVGGGTEPSPPAAVETFKVSGVVVLKGFDAHDGMWTSNNCAGKGSYDGVRTGAQLVISDDGKTAAVGKLNSGMMSTFDCQLLFSAEGVPAGLDFYTVTMPGQAPLKFTEKEMRAFLRITLD